MDGPPGFDLVVNFPIPKGVIDGQTTQTAGIVFEVVEAPSIRLPLPIHH
jgi:hypothetical protein